MFHFGRSIVRVTFVDHASGAVISKARMPLQRLPERFLADTQLKMAGDVYLVVRADPPTKAEFRGTTELTVRLRKQPPPTTGS